MKICNYCDKNFTQDAIRWGVTLRDGRYTIIHPFRRGERGVTGPYHPHCAATVANQKNRK